MKIFKRVSKHLKTQRSEEVAVETKGDLSRFSQTPMPHKPGEYSAEQVAAIMRVIPLGADAAQRLFLKAKVIGPNMHRQFERNGLAFTAEVGREIYTKVRVLQEHCNAIVRLVDLGNENLQLYALLAVENGAGYGSIKKVPRAQRTEMDALVERYGPLALEVAGVRELARRAACVEKKHQRFSGNVAHKDASASEQKRTDIIRDHVTKALKVWLQEVPALEGKRTHLKKDFLRFVNALLAPFDYMDRWGEGYVEPVNGVWQTHFKNSR